MSEKHRAAGRRSRGGWRDPTRRTSTNCSTTSPVGIGHAHLQPRAWVPIRGAWEGNHKRDERKKARQAHRGEQARVRQPRLVMSAQPAGFQRAQRELKVTPELRTRAKEECAKLSDREWVAVRHGPQTLPGPRQ